MLRLRPSKRVIRFEAVQYTGGKRGIRRERNGGREKKNVSVTGTAVCIVNDFFHKIEVRIKENVSSSNDRLEGERLRRATLKAIRGMFPRYVVRSKR